MKITTLIPAYKPQYLNELLTALQKQSLRPDRIVFSDDSPDQSFVRLLGGEAIKTEFPELNIEVVPGPRCGAWANFQHLLEHHVGETDLFHLQLDDDIPYPAFYERHVQAHAMALTECVVSRRWTAAENGQPTAAMEIPPAIHTHPQKLLVLDAGFLFPQTIATFRNWLGEFSNATFRAGMREELLTKQLAGISFTGLEDIGGFLAASLKAPLIYINENLGFFRTSPEQNTAQQQGRIFKLSVLGWIALALAGRRLGHVSAEQSVALVQRICALLTQHYSHDAALAHLATLARNIGPDQNGAAEQAFLVAWHEFVKT